MIKKDRENLDELNKILEKRKGNIQKRKSFWGTFGIYWNVIMIYILIMLITGFMGIGILLFEITIIKRGVFYSIWAASGLAGMFGYFVGTAIRNMVFPKENKQ